MPVAHTPASSARRTFLHQLALGAAGLLAPRQLLALDRAAPWMPGATPVRVRGRVIAAGRPVRNVAVTDGVTVAATGSDGRFELLADGGQPFVYLSLPAGYGIPRNGSGTARFYQPLRADARGEASAVFELVPLARGDDEHALLLLADPQTQDREEMGWLHAQTVPDARATVRALGDRHVFGVACGDIMFDDLALYPDYERAVAAIGVPFFQAVGNHDLDTRVPADEDSTVTFQRHFGPRYYSFDRGAVHYVVMDDVLWHGSGYVGYLEQTQMRWLAQDLARVERGKPVVAMLHIPPLSTLAQRAGAARSNASESLNNREALYRLLEPYKAMLLSGHMHEHEVHTDGGALHVVSGAVCGAWWSGPICYDGTPNGYGVFEAKGEEIRWRYKSTGLDAAHQIRTYPAGADRSAPEEVVANVWGWDPQWSVVWYENGERRGAMARRPGLDPLAVQLHTGPELPPRRKWVDPVPTGHLFYAPVSPGAREVRVEATDRFGRRYSAPIAAAARQPSGG